MFVSIIWFASGQQCSGIGYVSVQDSSDLRPSNAITFTAWFNSYSFDLGSYSWPAVLKKSTYPNQNDGYAMETQWVYESAPEMSSDMVTSGSGLTISHLPISTNTWYFGAGVYDGTTLKFYLGQSDLRTLDVNSQNCSGTIQNSLGELWIGADPANPYSNRAFTGAIDDVRIFNKALSVAEINQIYNAESLTDGLVGWWNLDGNGNDSSGLGHDGTINGSVTATQDRFGNADSALLFNVVPEPSTFALLSVGAISLLAYVWRRRKLAA
jgi:hypothetical protein